MDDGSVEPRESLIKAIAEQINKNTNDISGYRRVQVMIRGAEHIPPAPQQVVSLMMELIYAYNLDIRGGRDPFEREAEFHIRFERIHPFEDGNGRTGRILLNRGLLLSDVAPAVISVDDRAHYLDLIGHQDVAGLAGLLRRLPRRRRRGSRRSSGRVRCRRSFSRRCAYLVPYRYQMTNAAYVTSRDAAREELR